MNEEYLVIGGLGHIGYNVVNELVKENKKVRVLLHNKKFNEKLPKEVNIFYGDVNKKDSLVEFFKVNKKTITYLINASNYYSIFEKDNKKMKDVIVDGAKNILDLSIENKIDKLIFIGNIDSNEEIYHNKCKNEMRNIINNYYDNLNISIVTPTYFIGPHDYRGNILNDYLYMIKNNKINKFIDTTINLIDVRDLSKVIVDISLYGENKKEYFVFNKNYNTKDILNSYFKINKFVNKDKLIKYEKLYLKYCEFKKKEPIYNKNILLLNNNVNNKNINKDIKMNFRSIEETLKDTNEFLNLV